MHSAGVFSLDHWQIFVRLIMVHCWACTYMDMVVFKASSHTPYYISLPYLGDDACRNIGLTRRYLFRAQHVLIRYMSLLPPVGVSSSLPSTHHDSFVEHRLSEQAAQH